MRVHPHLPSRPLTAIVIASDGSACCACSAANRPAPPAPRIRISVESRRIAKAFTARALAAEAHARAFRIDELRQRDAVLGSRDTRETHPGRRQDSVRGGDVVA